MNRQSIDDDRRLSPRAEAHVQVVFKVPLRRMERKKSTEEAFQTFYSENISEGGVFLRTEKPLKVGTMLDLHFSLPNSPRMIYAKGKVIWTVESRQPDPEKPMGMGVQFIEIVDEFRGIIRDYVVEQLEQETT